MNHNETQSAQSMEIHRIVDAPSDEAINSPKSFPETKFRHSSILKNASTFFVVTIIVQGLTFLTGLLLVRVISPSQYALFTIATAMQSTLFLLSDSGVSSALSARGGIVWQDREKFGSLIQSCLSFRRKFMLVATGIIGPILWWMLFSHQASFVEATIITLLILVMANIMLINSVLVVVPRLRGNVSQLQQAELVNAVVRLSIIILVCCIWRSTIAIVGAGIIAVWIQQRLYSQWAQRDVDMQAKPNDEDRAAIWKAVRPLAPNIIYYCIQGQLTIFLISIFGKTGDIADIGALGRISVIFGLISNVITNVIVPRFARSHDATKLKMMYLQTLGAVLAISMLSLLIAAYAPQVVLWLLGPRYSHLKHELLLIVLTSALTNISGLFHLFNFARGWLEYSWSCFMIYTVIQIISLSWLDVSTVRGVLWFNILPLLPGMIPFIWRAYTGIKEVELQNKNLATSSP